ncbi:MAG: hypothetical protein KBF33_15610, partial [Comamonas sp.]|nr:hypothetical protein [Comamonas sp.]
AIAATDVADIAIARLNEANVRVVLIETMECSLMVASRKMPAVRNTQQIRGWMQRIFLFLSCCGAAQGGPAVLVNLEQEMA